MAGFSDWYNQGELVGFRVTYHTDKARSKYFKGRDKETRQRAKEYQTQMSLKYPYKKGRSGTTSAHVGVNFKKEAQSWVVPYKRRDGAYRTVRFSLQTYGTKAHDRAVACRKFLERCRAREDMESFYRYVWQITERDPNEDGK